MTWYQNLRHAKEYVLSFFKWLALGTALGILGGLVGTAFHFALDWATEFRESHDIVLWFLPLAGLPIVGLYRLCHMEKNSGTNEIIDDFNTRTDVNPFLAPLIFISTFLTHLFGGSAGREGAAMQLGGAIGSGFGRILRLSKEDRRVLVVSGMGAVFAALFGTPVTACCPALPPPSSPAAWPWPSTCRPRLLTCPTFCRLDRRTSFASRCWLF